LLKNARDLVTVNMIEDPHYGVIVDYSETVKET
jgi:hypothetical protein